MGKEIIYIISWYDQILIIHDYFQNIQINVVFLLGLSMFLVSKNISIFSPYKIFGLLLPIKFSNTTFGPYF